MSAQTFESPSKWVFNENGPQKFPAGENAWAKNAEEQKSILSYRT